MVSVEHGTIHSFLEEKKGPPKPLKHYGKGGSQMTHKPQWSYLLGTWLPRHRFEATKSQDGSRTHRLEHEFCFQVGCVGRICGMSWISRWKLQDYIVYMEYGKLDKQPAFHSALSRIAFLSELWIDHFDQKKKEKEIWCCISNISSLGCSPAWRHPANVRHLERLHLLRNQRKQPPSAQHLSIHPMPPARGLGCIKCHCRLRVFNFTQSCLLVEFSASKHPKVYPNCISLT